MNQIIPVGKGILFAAGEITASRAEELRERWVRVFPDVPMLVVNAQLVERLGGPTVFEFTGDVTPTVVAEFQRWWAEVNQGVAQGGTIEASGGRPPGH